MLNKCLFKWLNGKHYNDVPLKQELEKYRELGNWVYYIKCKKKCLEP